MCRLLLGWSASIRFFNCEVDPQSAQGRGVGKIHLVQNVDAPWSVSLEKLMSAHCGNSLTDRLAIDSSLVFPAKFVARINAGDATPYAAAWSGRDTEKL